MFLWWEAECLGRTGLVVLAGDGVALGGREAHAAPVLRHPARVSPGRLSATTVSAAAFGGAKPGWGGVG
eukprot:COSAG04_NODE_91_length_26852_cov_8.609315_34_plen_69_part_00